MIRLENVTKIFGEQTSTPVTALDRLSLNIETGEFVVVIGSNGSGKSTLLNVLAGAERPQNGSVLVDNMNVTRQHAHQRARYVGRVFQNPFSGTAPSMTVAENLRMAELRGQPKRMLTGLNRRRLESYRARTRELGMDLEQRMTTPIGLLSGGQRQALTLLMATMRAPKLILLDEHTAALDPKSASQVLELTQRIVKQHALTAVMVTHDMSEAVRMGSRLLMMHMGRVTLDVRDEQKHLLTEDALHARFADLRRAEDSA